MRKSSIALAMAAGAFALTIFAAPLPTAAAQDVAAARTSVESASTKWVWINSDQKYGKFFSPANVQVTAQVNGVATKIVAWTQEVSANYPVADIFGDKRTAINAELDVYLREKFEPYGIIIDTVNFTDISVDDETAAAIQKKVNAQQNKELAQIEAETAAIQAEKDRQVATINAERDKEVAQIEADKKLISAQADADALLIAAEAEADANKKIAESLTPELIEKIKYDKWDGSVPKVIGGMTPIVDIGPVE